MAKLTELELLEGIKEGKTIAMNCYTLTDAFVKNLEVVIKHILNQYDKLDLLPAIFGVVQELANWTCISNMRYIYYSQNNLQISSEEEFIKTEPQFLSSINKINTADYRTQLKENKMYAHMVFRHEVTGLQIKVFNLAEKTLDQEKYLRGYLKNAMSYTNILDYFGDHAEDPQGKNLGLAFSLIILKEAGLRPELMRISRSGQQFAYSRLEIPFIASYESIRDKILNDEPIHPFERKSLVPPEYQKQLEEKIKQMPLDSYEFMPL